jgi:malic enzyme
LWSVAAEPGEVVLDLTADEGLGFFTLMAMVDGFDAGLEAKRDEQTDGDGEEVKEEVARAVNSVFRRMNIEHESAPEAFR